MTTTPSSTFTRPVSLHREGSTFRVVFAYDAQLVDRAKELPFAAFDPDTKSWTCMVCAQSVDQLRDWYRAGLTDVAVDTLLAPDETPAPVKEAVLRPGSLRRPYQVATALRNDRLFAKLRAIPGASWDRAAHALSYPLQAAAALHELVERGVLDDPDRLLSPAAVTISFDSRTGLFTVRGDDRAQRAFNTYFPRSDVMAAWRAKGLDVAFSDSFTEEVYRGELARANPDGVQPDGLKATLWPYQAQSVAVALERTGFGVFHEMGLGKALSADMPVLTPTGWLPIGELRVGDRIVSRTGEATTVRGVYPQGLRELVTVHFSDRASVTCDLDHLWTVTDTTTGTTSTHTTAELMDAPPLTYGCRRYAIPVCDPVVFEDTDNPFSPALPNLFDYDVRIEMLARLIATGRVVNDYEQRPRLVLRLVEPLLEHAQDLVRSMGGILDPLVHPSRALLDPMTPTNEWMLALPSHVMRDLQANASWLAHQLNFISYDPERFITGFTPAPAGEAVCIKVAAPDELFVTKDYVVTHNTVIALGVGHELMHNRSEVPRTVVVVPGSVRTQWADEIARFSTGKVVVIDGDAKKRKALYEEAASAQWLIVHYDVISRDYALLAPLVTGSLLVADEAHRCFPAGTMVMTSTGPMDIQDIVKNRLAVEVLAWDAVTGTTTYKPVVDWMESPAPPQMVRITHSHGTITCTPNHPIWTEERGYVPASEIRSGETLRHSSQGGSPHCTRVERVEVIERAGAQRPGVSGDDHSVYNIEVGDLHSYVADGVVVHNCKNPTSKRTKTMRQLSLKAARRIALTGTPIQNDPGEWYSVVSGLVSPGCFGSAMDFLSRYSYPSRFGGFEGARNLGELRTRSATFYIRNIKSEVATHLPPLRVQHRPLDVDPTYRAALVRAHREARDEIKAAALDRAARTGRTGHVLDGTDKEEVETGAEMTAVGMLRLLCSSPRIIEESDSEAALAMIDAGLLPDADGPKLDALREMAIELQDEGHRVVVFTFSKRMANLISQRLIEDGVRHVLFTGDTSKSDRDEAVAAFTAAPTPENPGPTVFVATDAGGEGLNLGRHCSLLVNMDIPWTPGVLAQRSARIHRIDGTADKYLVINFTLKGTIEEGILRMVERKADLQDAIFGEGGGRNRTTGRGGRGVFDEAMAEWDAANEEPNKPARTPRRNTSPTDPHGTDVDPGEPDPVEPAPGDQSDPPDSELVQGSLDL
jgi:superfamily II DNA or RNA helicase